MSLNTETKPVGEGLSWALTEVLRMNFKYSEENAEDIRVLRKKMARVLREMRSLSTRLDEHLKEHAT